jgi:hypothetical protein
MPNARIKRGRVAQASCTLVRANSRQHPVAGEIPKSRKLPEIDVWILRGDGERLDRLDQPSSVGKQQPAFCFEPRGSLATGGSKASPA